KLMGCLSNKISFFLFFANIKKTHTRVFNFVNVLGKERTQNTKLVKHIRFTIGIGTYIKQNTKTSRSFWQYRGNSRPIYTFYGFNAENSSNYHSSGVSCTYKGINIFFFKMMK